jgi:alkaline phosphatase D
MAIWDDHDFGTNDGGADFPFKEQTRELFLDFFGEPPDSERRRTPGLYYAQRFGPPGQRLQIIMLDGRSFKGPQIPDTRSAEEKQALNIVGRYVPNPDSTVTLLGGEQWQWLEQQLLEEAELRLIVSGTQIVAGEKGAESWGNYPGERQRLYELIESTRARGVILLSGDVHFSEISRTDEGPYPLYDFTSSNLAQTETGWEAFKNSHRVAGPYAEPHFGVVEIDWDARLGPAIELKVIGLDGSVAYRHELSLEALR